MLIEINENELEAALVRLSKDLRRENYSGSLCSNDKAALYTLVNKLWAARKVPCASSSSPKAA